MKFKLEECCEVNLRLLEIAVMDDFEEKLEVSKFTMELRQKLYYAFRHRTYTAQTLLLSFESYSSAAQFAMQVT